MVRKRTSSGAEVASSPQADDECIASWYLTNTRTRKNAHYFVAIFHRPLDRTFFVATAWGAADRRDAKSKYIQKEDWSGVPFGFTTKIRNSVERYAMAVVRDKTGNGYELHWTSETSSRAEWYMEFYKGKIDNKPYWWLDDDLPEDGASKTMHPASTPREDYSDMDELSKRMRESARRKGRAAAKGEEDDKTIKRVGRFSKIKK